ncbi:MAG: NAD-dependent malic enzyme [Myxococcales bacterium]|nr:NAD-dependent malic enzyme [Myxococcales bacterium]
MSSEVRFERDARGKWRAHTSLRGRALIAHGLLNKGSAFSAEERRTFQLEGLFPHAVSSVAQQVLRAIDNARNKTEALQRYVFLSSLQDRNETLFHRVVLENLEELLPVVYTPTVGQACQHYSHLFRRGRGVWITPEHKGRVRQVLSNAATGDVRLIVLTDNERILGLGDLGAGGMGIPVGKLALYTVAAGIHPSQVLPMSLDVGTDNESLLRDPQYLGFRQPRLRGEPYLELVEELVAAIRAEMPSAVLQWEDFKKGNAFLLMERYRDRLPSFNDDIEGTAAVVMAGVLAACRAKRETLAQQRIVILGAGAAGVGTARQLIAAFERAGPQPGAKHAPVAVLDSCGLVVEGRNLRDEYKRSVAWSEQEAEAAGLDAERSKSLLEVVRALRPTVLIGASATPGLFTESVVREMARTCERPMILPLSNPTSKCEARPEDVLRWSEGRALVATGSPFPPVTVEGKSRRIAQANNVFVFPGVGLGLLACGARRVSDAMFLRAAETLATCVGAADLAEGELYPPQRELRQIARAIAEAVARQARDEGACEPLTDDEIVERVGREMWLPEYPELVAE